MSATYKKGGYTVRNHKELRTSDGFAMNGTLCFNGQPVGTYEDGGYGGPMQVEFKTPADAAGFHGHLLSLPPTVFHGRALQVDEGMFICFLVEEFLNARRIARLLKTSVLFTLPGDKDGTLRTLKHKGDVPGTRAWVLSKYPTATFVEG